MLHVQLIGLFPFDLDIQADEHFRTAAPGSQCHEESDS